jgi:hypothetical protein
MAVYNIHGGHSLVCRGAAALLDEVNEDRKVKNRVIELLRAAGHTVYDCTDDSGTTQNQNLSAIVQKCNAHNVNLDVSIHLNSGRNDLVGNGSTGGVEVWGYDDNTRTTGEKICAEIASVLGYTNRGFKTTHNLYVLNNTHSQAILIECAFVDDKDDADRWDANRCAEAIVKALTGSVPVTVAPASNKYSIGQEVSYGTSYRNSSDPCGYEYATGGSGYGRIIGIVEGQAKYKLSSGVYCNDGDIYGLYAAPVTQQKNPTVQNVYYKVYAGGRWYSEVKNLDDYAGDAIHAIKGIAVKVDIGSVKYRVHTRNGRWYPYVTGYNIQDGNNGYAGDLVNDIDMVEIYYTTPAGYVTRKAKYRVAPVGKNYYSWQLDNETGNGMDGYAGAAGVQLGKLQIVLE